MMNNSRDIIRWAFENEPNAISDVYDCQNQFVVAALVSITEKGYRPVESVSNEVTNLARKNKKAEQLIADMTTSNIHELATKMNLQIDTVSQVNFASSSFGKEGNENAVIGSIAIGEKDKISAPIKGNNGVYVYAIVNQLSNTSPYNEEVEKQSLELRSKYAVYRAVEALKDKAEIEDNRSRFY
jgi:peptidyl-prolyl cis-trans isomerase D